MAIPITMSAISNVTGLLEIQNRQNYIFEILLLSQMKKCFYYTSDSIADFKNH